jgi:hypothetical protein
MTPKEVSKSDFLLVWEPATFEHQYILLCKRMHTRNGEVNGTQNDSTWCEIAPIRALIASHVSQQPF